jgi:CHAT domain-containing protein
LGQPAEAVKALQAGLSIARHIGDRGGESVTLSNLGNLFAQQKQPRLAITFYKESVNLIESIRSDLRSLPKEQQESYTKTVADTYRHLADLLITQGRIAEAQQVLELLKTQELNDFTKGTRAAAQLADVPLNQTEQKLREQYGTLIALGAKLDDCNEKCLQYHALQAQYDALNQAFAQQVQEIENFLRDRRQEQVGKGTQEFIAGADKIVSEPGTVLIYPLVLPDKVRLLWAAKGTVFSGTAVCPFGETQLWQTVAAFRQLLDTPTSDRAQVKTIGKQLYDCLVKPIEKELQANQIQHLVFVPDLATNYIPMGALFDGKKYLIETYTVSNILSVKGTDMTARLPIRPQDISILALGLSNPAPGFNALPNVPAELAAIVKQTATDRQGVYPGTKLLNQAFTEETLRAQLKGRTILHIATHGAFKPDNPRNSYLLLGTGNEYPIYKIQLVMF